MWIADCRRAADVAGPSRRVAVVRRNVAPVDAVVLVNVEPVDAVRLVRLEVELRSVVISAIPAARSAALSGRE